jgi:tetratricopeptide (TPR) repeat protein
MGTHHSLPLRRSLSSFRMFRLGIGLLAAYAAMPVLADPIAELDDAAARAQYAFYTADIRGLDQVVQIIERLEVPETLTALKAYNAAYARWKLAQLYDDAADHSGPKSSRSLATKAAQACLVHTKTALTADAKMVEAYVVDAACSTLAHTARSGEVQSSIPACARSRSFRTAQELAPENPRVMLMEGSCLHTAKAAPDGSAIDRLRAIVDAFEAAPPARAGYPDWGQAEALLLLGENYLQRGDTRAARDVIEKALVIAPDYRKARELLDTAAVRPR